MFRKRRKRKSHYKVGEHASPKLLNGPAHYRSGWELTYMKWLDANDDVKSYEYESIVIAYISNMRSCKVRKYFPDIFVHFQDGKNVLVEIKPKRKLLNPTVIKKQLAAEQWCKENNATYELVTEDTIKNIKID